MSIRAFVPKSLSGLAWLIALFVLLAGATSIIVPPFETPDEIWHFAFIQQVASGGGLPIAKPASQELWRQQGTQAPAYYLAAAGLTFPIDQSDFRALYERANPHAAIGRPDATSNRNYLIHYPEENWPWRGSVLALHIARFLSVILGAITLWGTYHTLALLVGQRVRGLALLGTACVGFIPQFIFISASASNDNAINALAALLLWQLVALLVGETAHPLASRSVLPFTTLRRTFLIIGALLGLALLSKLSALGLAGLTGLAVLAFAWRHRSWRLLVEAAVIVGATAGAVAGWWYARNWLLYRDLLAWNIWEANILLRVVPGSWRTIFAELGSLERSFWGLFGWMNVPYPNWVYTGFRAWEILCAVGLAVAGYELVRRYRASRFRHAANTNAQAGLHHRLLAGSLLVAWLALLAVSWVRFMRVAPAAQGRYFFPAASSLALLSVTGMQGLAALASAGRRWLSKHSPATEVAATTAKSACADLQSTGEEPVLTARKGLSKDRFGTGRPQLKLPAGVGGWALIPAALLVLSAVTPAWIILPAYRPPPAIEPAVSSVPPRSQSGAGETAGFQASGTRVELGDQFAILEVSAELDRIRPGETAEVTVFWQALQPGPTDYSVFVHLRNEIGLPVAQVDTMPGGGLLPTSQWSPGQTRGERYRITVPLTAYTPDRGQWAVGLYDHRTGQRLPMRLVTPPSTEYGGNAFVLKDEDALGFGAVEIVALSGVAPNPIAVPFEDNITLAGYSFSERRLTPGQAFSVVLYWQARGSIVQQYTSFAHLLDRDYQTRGGHDGEPRPPTRAWSTDEIVTDRHDFVVAQDAPAGLYQVEVGLYTRPDFARLSLVRASGAEGADRLLLGPLLVVQNP